MASHRIVVPLVKKGGCLAVPVFDDTYHAAMAAHLSAFDWSNSIQRINAANQLPTGPRVALTISLVGFIIGFQMLCGSGAFSSGYGYMDPSAYWGLWIFILSLMGVTVSARAIKRAQSNNVTAAVLKEHELYSCHQPQVCWRIINPGKRTATLEIDLLHPLISANAIAVAPTSDNSNNHQQHVIQHQPAPTIEPSSSSQYSYNGFHQAATTASAVSAPSVVATSAYPQITPPPSYSLPASHHASNDHLIYVNQPQQMQQGLLNSQYQYQ